MLIELIYETPRDFATALFSKTIVIDALSIPKKMLIGRAIIGDITIPNCKNTYVINKKTLIVPLKKENIFKKTE